MIILDTNVVSELMKPRPEPAVFAWVERQARQGLATTSVTKAEILYGIARLPDGRRKSALAEAAERMFRTDFNGHLLTFDDAATHPYAAIVSERAGRPAKTLDALIAAIASAANAVVATRNVGDFEGCGVGVVNPWTA